MNRCFIVLLQLYIINIICIQTSSVSSRETSELFRSLINYNKKLSNETNTRYISKREAGLGLDVLKAVAIDKYEKLQSNRNGSKCIPGSLSYNGTCMFFSRDNQKLSWRNSERFCRKLPFNTSFLVIQNDHQIETIKTELLKLRNKENPSDQLVFYVGFSFTSNEWKWVNNQSLRSTNLTLGRYFWDWTGSHGDCGSLALLKNNELVMRSAPCQSTKGRFICEYTLDPCHENNMCGKYGKCINLYYKPYCDCSVTIFYEGKYCEKLNWNALQTIAAIFIVFILLISIFCQTSMFGQVWNEFFGKDSKETKIRKKNEDIESQPHVEFGTSLSDENNKQNLLQSVSERVKKMRDSLFESLIDLNKKEYSAYLLLIFSTCFLAFTQVSIIHGFFLTKHLNEFKKHQKVKDMCNIIEGNYLVEELFYLVPALIFFIVLWFYHRTRRFNKYIMLKFKRYFKTKYYKDLMQKQKLEKQKEIEETKRKIKDRKCGECRLCLFNCLRHNFCRVFCCLFCCSCCVPPGSNYRCCWCYYLKLGWQNTDCGKVTRAIKNLFYYLFLCCIWKRLWKLTKEQIQRNKEAKKAKELKRKQSAIHGDDDDIYDLGGEIDETDFNEDQEFKRTTFPFPSMPFSTSNRAQSASVYVIYTYDVLNIFVYIYTATVSNINIPYFGRPSGILFDFLIQVLHVLLIGIKFYPILIVADMDPFGVVYFFATIYMFIIWSLKLFTKGFCSRTEAFVKQTLKKLSSDIGSQIKGKIQTRYNISNSVLGLFSDEPDPTKEYLSNIKNVIPNVFKEFFGKYDQASSLNSFDFSSLNDDYNLSPDKYYGTEMTQAIDFITTTPISTTTTTSYGFRDRLKNKTISKAKSFMEILSERNETSDMVINILENLPLYLTLSFLLSRYFILCFGCLVDFCRRRRKSKSADYQFFNQTERETIKREDFENIKLQIDKYMKELEYIDENHFTSEAHTRKNHNYYYIQRLLEDINFFKNYPDNKKKEKKRRTVSFFLDLWHRYIYQNTPYMKYSKQYINTYTVAFMVIYFFTLFGFRLSNLFGNSIIVTFELIYRFIFRGMIPEFNFNDHNFNLEFRVTCLCTSLVVAWQLFRSIRSFHEDLKKLHKGEKLIATYVKKYRDKQSIQKSAEERHKASSTITSDSLHFPGYLIAHLVYGYALLFLVFFCFTIFFKLLSYFPKLFQISSQVLLPLVMLVSLKLIVVKYATRFLFLREDGQRITNLAPYYTVTYFNFFFDCFLGFVACASRIWQTTVMSVLTLPRLDKSMFNRDNDLIVRRLDKGHVSYLNYVRMEHWYNNPVVNGFCEMLIESMLCSQIYKIKFESKAKIEVEFKSNQQGGTAVIKREISRTNNVVTYEISHKVLSPLFNKSSSENYYSNNKGREVRFNLNKTQSEKSFIPPSIVIQPAMSRLTEGSSNIEDYSNIEYENDPNDDDQTNQPDNKKEEITLYKKSNPRFQYSSFLRLRNVFYLCLLLDANPSLRKFRHHYLANLTKNSFQKDFEVETLSDMLKNKVLKRVQKFKSFVKGSAKSPSVTKASFTGDIQNTSDSNANIIENEQHNYESNSSLNSSGSRKRSHSK